MRQPGGGYLQSEILPAVTAGIELGKDMLEIGPGPGAATGWLSRTVAKLTALESDDAAAALLAERYSGDNVNRRYRERHADALPGWGV